MESAQEVEMLRRQLDELTAQMIEVRQQSSSTAMHAAVSGLTEAVRTMGQSVSKPRPEDMRVGKPEPYAPGKDFADWDFTFNGYAGTLDPAYPTLLKTARQSPTVVMATPPHEQQSATFCCTFLRYSHGKEHGKEHGKLETTVSKLTDNCACETRRWGERYWSRSRPSEKRRALFRTRLSLWRHIFSWMLVNWETSTHYAWRLKITWGADASSRQLHPETHTMRIQWKSMPSPGKGKAKKKSGKGKKGCKQGKESHSCKGYGETTTEHSRFEGECRNCGKYGHKASDLLVQADDQILK